MAAVVDSSTAFPDIEMKEIDLEEGVAKGTEISLPVVGPEKHEEEDAEEVDENAGGIFSIKFATDLSFAVNILLFAAKIVAAVASGSLAVLASTADSFLDLLSGSIVWLTERAMQKVDLAAYPAGRTRLEPVGVVVFATMMGMATLQLLSESVKELLGSPKDLTMGPLTVVILGSTILLKFGLYLLCAAVKSRCKTSASVDALRVDHRNDCFSNAVAVVAALIAAEIPSVWWLDPLGAAVIALYILSIWIVQGYEQIQNLSGKVADEDFVQEIRTLCTQHREVLEVDKLRCYHFGLRMMVEVEIVLPEDMALKDTHDIGLELQHLIEDHDDVERAFVHVDYQARPHEEHRIERELLEEALRRANAPRSPGPGASIRRKFSRSREGTPKGSREGTPDTSPHPRTSGDVESGVESDGENI